MHGLGWKKSLPDERDKIFAPKFGGALLPPIVDLTCVKGATKNQLETSSCTGHAGSELGELIQRESNKLNAYTPLSAAYLYYMAKATYEGGFNADDGAYGRDIVKTMARYGCAPEALYPLPPDGKFTTPSDDANKAAEAFKIETYSTIQSSDDARISALLSAHAQGHGVMCGIYVYSSFMSAEAASTGVITIPDVSSETLEGGHEILLLGYLQSQKTIKFQNSWGKAWGQGGCGYLPFEYLAGNLADDFWIVEK